MKPLLLPKCEALRNMESLTENFNFCSLSNKKMSGVYYRRCNFLGSHGTSMVFGSFIGGLQILSGRCPAGWACVQNKVRQLSFAIVRLFISKTCSFFMPPFLASYAKLGSDLPDINPSLFWVDHRKIVHIGERGRSAHSFAASEVARDPGAAHS